MNPVEPAEIPARTRAGLARELAAMVGRITLREAEFGEEDAFLEKSGMSSLQTVQFTVKLDELFGLKFGTDPEDFEAMTRFGSMVDLIHRRRAK